MDTRIGFSGKWIARIVDAIEVDSVWQFQVDKQFIPVNEIALPYKLDHLSPTDAKRVLHGSAVNQFATAFNGYNTEYDAVVMQPGAYDHHFFLTDAEKADEETETTSAVAEGDSLLVFVCMD